MHLIDHRRTGRLPCAVHALLARLAAACLCMLLVFMPAWAAAADGSYGVHGMVLFGGKDGLYASHLPMFHAPHDAQVVLRVRIADPDLDRQARSRLDGGTALWTLDPERFALRRLAPGAAQPLDSFSADIVEGHFEQGGRVRHRGALLAVEEVVLFRPLDPARSVASTSRYLPLGPFLVKLIDSRPDFDHIVLLKKAARGPVTVAKAGMAANQRALEASASVAGTIYYCADDLR